MEIEEFEPGDAIYKKGDVGRSGAALRKKPWMWKAFCVSMRGGTDGLGASSDLQWTLQ